MSSAATYDADVGRPRKRPEDRFTTPAKSFRPYPPENWETAKRIAARRAETITDVLNRSIQGYIDKYGTPEDQP
jgi:hypothetical protein